MESKKENRGLNLVIVHKETRWKKFKGRVSSWFTSDKSAAEIVVVPEIIVTSPEDTTGEFSQRARIAILPGLINYQPNEQMSNRFTQSVQDTMLRTRYWVQELTCQDDSSQESSGSRQSACQLSFILTVCGV